ncbi:MAG: hypothetical protein FWH15_07920 [Betaproteobacteria bacterium]|nr:hypothetical protein [Betaproteobacteria bacterium]
MAWTQDDLDRIEQAISRNELEVRYADRMIRYRSMDELIKARQMMLVDLHRPRRRIVRCHHAGKGF